MASKELEPVELEGYLAAVATPEVQDPEQVADELVRRTLRAQSVDDLFTKASLTSIRGELLGVPLEFHDVRFNKSSYDGREGVYAVVKAARLDTGEMVTAGIGARSIMAALYRAKTAGWLPFQGKVIASPRPTSGGYYPLNLVPVDE